MPEFMRDRPLSEEELINDLGEEWVRKYLRGCKDITKPTDRKPHFITKSGKEVVVDTTEKFELFFFGIGLCPYNAQRLSYPWPDDGPYWMDEPEAGTWGFIDTEGKVAVEPQYVYAIGPFGYKCEKEYFDVAKMIDGKLRWGVLDYTGTETIPCRYATIQYTDYDVVSYQEEDDGLYGLMKVDGTIILKPKFANIFNHAEIDMNRKVLVAGSDPYFEGVYSLEQDRFIIPCRFGYIYFLDDYIVADYPQLIDYEEIKEDEADYAEFLVLVRKNNIEFGGCEYFDYEGNMLDKAEIRKREYQKQLETSEEP